MAGAALAGLGLFLAPAGASVATSTTLAPATPTSAESGPWWFEPTETLLGPTAILLDGISFEEGQVVVRYELRDISPPALGRLLGAGEINPFFAPPREDPVAVPEIWVLETTNGEYPGTSASTRVRSARFDVPENFILGTITGLRVEGYRMRMPYIAEVEVPAIEGSRVVLDNEYSFAIGGILQQRDSVIVSLDTVGPHASFTAGEPTPVIIRGIGTDWVSYNQRQFEGLQLILGSGDLPDPLLLEVRSTYWVPFESSLSVELGGVNIG